MSITSPTKPEPVQHVRILRHRIHWEASDLNLAEVTAQRAMSLAAKIATGCWYLNPRYTVSSPAPTADFFRTVIDLRSTWLRTCRQIQGTSGQRSLSRQDKSQGRLGASLPADPEAPEEPIATQPSLSSSPPGLPDALRQEVIEAGQIAKGLGNGGIMFMDGNPIPPRTWQGRAEELLNPGPNLPVNVAHRKLNLATFKATGDPGPFNAISRAALQEHLARRPSHAAYVCPNVTVSAPSATPAFYEAVRRCQAQWCTFLNRTLGCGNVRRARLATDEATICLAYSGTLLIDRQLYLPGCWPIHHPKSGRLKQTPFQAPTVPPSYLGLDSPLANVPDLQGDVQWSAAQATASNTAGDLDGLFSMLLAADGPGPS